MDFDPRKLGSLDDVRAYLEDKGEGGELKKAAKDERVAWIQRALDHFQYENLSREEKGLIRHFLQAVSGYSRAQVERYISAYRAEVTQVRSAAIAEQAPAAPLPRTAETPWDKAMEWAATLDPRRGVHFAHVLLIAFVVTAIMRGGPASLIRVEKPTPTPARLQPTSSQRVFTTRRFVADNIISRTEARRQDRLVERLYGKAKQRTGSGDELAFTGSLSSMADLFGPHREGQVLMVRNGKAQWRSLPAGFLPSAGEEMPPGGGRKPMAFDESGQRHYGGGGGGGGDGATSSESGGSGGGGGGGLDTDQADPRYVNITGDTMIGALRIEVDGLGLTVTGTMSGKSLYVSGTGSTPLLATVPATGRVGVGTASPRAKLDVAGSLSGSSLTISNLKNCDTIDTDVNGTLVCGIDSGAGGGMTQAEADLRYVNQSGDGMTGALAISSGNPKPVADAGLLLEVMGTASGRVLRALTELTSSGTLAVEGASTFGGTVNVQNTNGFEIQFAGSAKANIYQSEPNETLFINTNGGNLALGTSNGAAHATLHGSNLGIGTATGGSRLTVSGSILVNPNGNVGSTAADAGLALEVIGTASGRIFHAQNILRGSGTLVLESGAYIDGTTFVVQAGNNRVGIGTATPVAALDVTAGGNSIYLTGNELEFTRAGAASYIDQLGGQDIIFRFSGSFTEKARVSNSSEAAFEVLGISSGQTLHAQNVLRSSGTLIVESGAIIDGGTLYVDAPGNRVGIGTTSPAAQLHSEKSGGGDQEAARFSAASGNPYITVGNGTASTNGGVILWDDTANTLNLGAHGGLYTIKASASLIEATGAGTAGADTEIARFNLTNATTHPFITVGTTSAGGFFMFNKESARARIGLHGANTYAFEYGATGSIVHANGATTAPLGALSVLSGNATTKGFVVRGAASQSANLQEWQNNAGAILASIDKSGSGYLGAALGIDTLTPGSKLAVSGSVIIGTSIGSAAADAGLGLEIIGTASGRIFHAQNQLRSSGSLVVESGTYLGGLTRIGDTATRGTLVVYGQNGFNQIQSYNISAPATQVFSVGPDGSVTSAGTMAADGGYRATAFGAYMGVLNGNRFVFNNGNIQVMSSGNEEVARFTDSNLGIDAPSPGSKLSVSGSVIIGTSIGSAAADAGLGLEIIGTASGRIFHAQNVLRSSGTLVLESGAIIDAGTLYVDAPGNRVGIGTTSPKATLDVVGTVSGAALVINGNANFNTNALDISLPNGTDILTTNSIGRLFLGDATEAVILVSSHLRVGGTSYIGFSNTTADAPDIGLQRLAAGILKVTNGSTGLASVVLGKGTTTTSKGTLTVYGSGAFTSTLSGSALNIQGGTSYILGSVGLGTSSPDAGLALEVIGTASGRIVHAQDVLRSSGTLITESGAIIDAGTLYISAPSNRVGIGTTAPKAVLDVVGSMSGDTLVVSGLRNCDTIDTNAQGVLTCGTDSGAGGGITQTDGDARYVNQSGDGMTGALIISNGNPKLTADTGLLLEVVGTSSGRVFHAQDLLRSSGSLVIETSSSFANGVIMLSATGSTAFNVNADNIDFSVKGHKNANLFYIDARGSGSLASGSGGVGIGTKTPITQLHVAGSVPMRAVGSGSTGLAAPYTVFVQGRYAYIADNAGSKLAIFDVSNPSSPVSVGSATAGLSGVRSVSVAGRYAYVASLGNDTLAIFDVSNPSSPLLVGTTTTGLSQPIGVTVQGRYAYVTNYNNNTLQIFDVSNPSAPVQVGSGSTGLNAPRNVSLQGRYAFITNDVGSKLNIFDVGNPFSPVSVSSFTTAAATRSVYVQGRYAYVGEMDRLEIIDISNPASPVSVSSITTGISQAYSTSVQGRYAYLASNGNGALVIIDVSNPSSPVFVGSVKAGLSGPITVFVQGRYAYVGDNTLGKLVIFDIGGAYMQQLEAGGLEAATVSTRGNAQIGNDLDVHGAGVFGRGLQILGTTSMTNTASGATAYTLALESRSGALRIAAGGTSLRPHILFGTGTTFDVKLYRSAANTLRTDSSFIVLQTISGSTIHASSVLRSSGTLITESGTYIDGTTFVVAAGPNRVGIVMALPETALDVGGGMSGLTLTLSNLRNCDTIDTNAQGVLACGTDSGAGGGITQAQGDAWYVNQSGDGMTGALAIASGNPKPTADANILLEVMGTSSGRIFHAQDVLRSSGTLVLESGAIIDGGTLYVSAPSNRVGIGTTTPKAALHVVGLISGTTVHAEKTLTSSGNLIVRSTFDIGPLGQNNIRLSNPSSGRAQFINLVDGTALAEVEGGKFFAGPSSASNDTILLDGINNTAIFGSSVPLNWANADNVNSPTMDVGIKRNAAGVLQFTNSAAGNGAIILGSPTRTTKALVIRGTGSQAANLTEWQNRNGTVIAALNQSGALVLSGSIVERGLALEVAGTMSGRSLFIMGTGASVAPLLDMNLPTGSVLIGTGGLKGASGSMMPQLYVAGRVPTARTGSGSTGAGPFSLFVQGRYLYVVNATGATLQIFDVSNPGMPQSRGSVATGAGPRSVYVRGQYAYVASSGGNLLQIVDVSNPVSPAVVGSVATSGGANSVYVQGQYAYVAAYIGNKLQVFDVSNPAIPVARGSATTSAGAIGVSVQGRYAYVVTREGNKLEVYDVNNPMMLTQVGTVTIGTNPRALYVQGRYAYIVDEGASSLKIVDLSNPASPTIIGSTTTGTLPRGIFVQGRYAYVTNVGADTLQMFDISNTSAPYLIGSLSTGSNADPLGIFVQGRYAYLTNHAKFSVHVYDVGGSYEQQFEAGGAEIGTLNVRNNFQAVDAAFQGGVLIGRGLQVLNPSSFTATHSGAIALTVRHNKNGTGVLISVTGSLAPGLAINTSTKSGALAPHILFGYKGTFDTNLYRASGSTLATDDQLMLTATNAENRILLRLDTEESTSTQNIFTITSDVTSNENLVFRITASGGVYSDAPYNSAGADYAEWFYTSDRGIRNGELVCIDVTRPNTVVRCTRDADPNVMGITSTRPAFIGNSISGAEGVIPPGYVLVGLIGQVPAMVTAENGPIRPGDQLTSSSIPGYARKANAGESTVGVALQNVETGASIVNVLISRRNQSITVEAVEEKVLKTIADMQIDDEIKIRIEDTLRSFNVQSSVAQEVMAQLDDLDLAAKIEREVAKQIAAAGTGATAVPREAAPLPATFSGGTVSSLSILDSLTVSGSVIALGDLSAGAGVFEKTLAVAGDTRVGGDLYLEGALHAGELFVPNGMTIDGPLKVGALEVTGPLTISNFSFGSGAVSMQDLTVKSALHVMGDITIDGLAQFLGDVLIRGKLFLGSQQVGTATAPAHGTGITVFFKEPWPSAPVVTVTPDVPILFAVRATSATGFTIMTGYPDVEVHFSWIAIGVDSGEQSAVLEEPDSAPLDLPPLPEIPETPPAEQQSTAPPETSGSGVSSAASSESSSSVASETSAAGSEASSETASAASSDAASSDPAPETPPATDPAPAAETPAPQEPTPASDPASVPSPQPPLAGE
jgi:cytoskeletal protein CcmA (bactofilin family)